MSEMVMIVPVIVLTGVVLVGILSVFRKYMAQRDRLDAEFLREQAAAEKKAAAAPNVAAAKKIAVLVQTRRQAA
jgi:hypothetical protein